MTPPLPPRPCQQKLKARFLGYYLPEFAGGAFATMTMPAGESPLLKFAFTTF
jgi:hypothetical protein